MQRIGPKKEGSAGGKDQVLTVSYFCPGTYHYLCLPNETDRWRAELQQF
jgi:hypothetical protein